MDWLLGILQVIIEIWLNWITVSSTDTERRFFYLTARIIIPILSLGILRVERYEDTHLADWRTLSVGTGEFVGLIFWIAMVCLLAAQLMQIT